MSKRTTTVKLYTKDGALIRKRPYNPEEMLAVVAKAAVTELLALPQYVASEAARTDVFSGIVMRDSLLKHFDAHWSKTFAGRIRPSSHVIEHEGGRCILHELQHRGLFLYKQATRQCRTTWMEICSLEPFDFRGQFVISDGQPFVQGDAGKTAEPRQIILDDRILQRFADHHANQTTPSEEDKIERFRAFAEWLGSRSKTRSSTPQAEISTITGYHVLKIVEEIRSRGDHTSTTPADS